MAAERRASCASRFARRSSTSSAACRFSASSLATSASLGGSFSRKSAFKDSYPSSSLWVK